MQMDVEIAGIGDQVDQPSRNQGEDSEKEKRGLEEFLAVGARVFDRAKFLLDRRCVQKGMLDDQFAKVERCSTASYAMSCCGAGGR